MFGFDADDAVGVELEVVVHVSVNLKDDYCNFRTCGTEMEKKFKAVLRQPWDSSICERRG
jgi:hypothetical protein